jgi:hypothetical protein
MKIKTGLAAGNLNVYGSQNCGWTRKQIAYLEKKGIDYTFIDCDTDACPDFVTGFPTLDQDGKISLGYREI